MGLNHAYRSRLTLRARELRANPGMPEHKLWHGYLRTGAHRFIRQKPLADYIVDFYCPSRQLVIEVDGDEHYSERAQAYDRRRSRILAKLGVRVLRFTNRDVMERFEGVCAVIAAALDASATEVSER